MSVKTLPTITWIDDELVGAQCTCGEKESLVIGIYPDEPCECDGCGRKFYVSITVKIVEVQE